MRAIKLQLATRTLLNPDAPQWLKAPVEEIRMAGASLHVQPSSYIRTVWAGKSIGAVRFLKAQAAHNSQYILFRLEWPDGSNDSGYGDGSVFPDAAAVVFPLQPAAPLATLGAPGRPVSLWYWRANHPDVIENLVSQGPASEEPAEGDGFQARARWRDGNWRLVVARTLAAPWRNSVHLGATNPAPVGFAIWEGSSQERAGLHSHSREWRDLVVE